MENQYPKYLFEKDRLASFKQWPFPESVACNVQSMAEAGFYWHGNGEEIDTAACFVCGKVLDGWEENDDPWKEHRKHAPQCVFVKNGKKESEYTVAQFYSLLGSLIKTTTENYKKQCLRYKNKFEELRETIFNAQKENWKQQL